MSSGGVSAVEVFATVDRIAEEVTATMAGFVHRSADNRAQVFEFEQFTQAVQRSAGHLMTPYMPALRDKMREMEAFVAFAQGHAAPPAPQVGAERPPLTAEAVPVMAARIAARPPSVFTGASPVFAPESPVFAVDDDDGGGEDDALVLERDGSGA